MFAGRQKLEAKYELLIENTRSTFNVKKTIAGIVLLTIIASLTSFALYVSWRSLKTGDEKVFSYKMAQISKNFSIDSNSLRRNYLYSKAWNLTKINQEDLNLNKIKEKVNSNEESSKLVCYYTLPESNISRDLMPEQIDAKLCTHINIGFAVVINNTLQPSKPSDIQFYKRICNLKTVNPSLKILISIGGAGEDGFGQMVSQKSFRKKFIDQLLSMLAEYTFDGVDLDWEFPSWESQKEEKENFILFLEELRNELDKSRAGYLLSVAVAAPKSIIDVAYDVPRMEKVIDYINIMTYDFHFYIWYMPLTGHNSPLYSNPHDNGAFATLNINWTVNYWLSLGMPKNKMVIGLSTYGHSFKLVNPELHGLSSPCDGFGTLGSNGFINYYQACWFTNNNTSTTYFDGYAKAPYAYRDTEWISYDNEESLAYKTEYIITQKFLGAMVFSLNTDDYEGKLSINNFPLTRRIRLVLNDDDL